MLGKLGNDGIQNSTQHTPGRGRGRTSKEMFLTSHRVKSVLFIQVLARDQKKKKMSVHGQKQTESCHELRCWEIQLDHAFRKPHIKVLLHKFLTVFLIKSEIHGGTWNLRMLER